MKILPGTRQQSLANSLTGALDDSYLLYANPGAAGLLREWQWSASYTEWIADIYNASLLYGKHLRINAPWSRIMTLGFGMNYQGIRNFDATRGAQPFASARDILMNVSVGMPFGIASRNFSLGANFKYLRSELAQHKASSFAFDVGLLGRTPRFRLSKNGLFRYGILSGGLSINQLLGNSLKFINVATPLPRTFRAGLALNLGTHNGLQLQLSADYQSVRDEKGRFSFGTELTNVLSPFNKNLGRAVAIRGGYNFNSNRNTDLVSKYSLGFSIRLDDFMYPHLKDLTQKNTALRFDAGLLQSSKFSNIYQGSATYFPTGPEHFEFVKSPYHSFATDEPDSAHTTAQAISLAWESTRDPDLYDDVNYIVLVVKEDRDALDSLITQTEKYDWNLFEFTKTQPYTGKDKKVDYVLYEPRRLTALNSYVKFDFPRNPPIYAYGSDSSFVDAKDEKIRALLLPQEQGDYYWTAVVYDNNGHIRFAKTNGSKIAHFRVEPFPPFRGPILLKPDLTIDVKVIAKHSESPEIYFEMTGNSDIPNAISDHSLVSNFGANRARIFGVDSTQIVLWLKDITEPRKYRANIKVANFGGAAAKSFEVHTGPLDTDVTDSLSVRIGIDDPSDDSEPLKSDRVMASKEGSLNIPNINYKFREMRPLRSAIIDRTVDKTHANMIGFVDWKDDVVETNEDNNRDVDELSLSPQNSLKEHISILSHWEIIESRHVQVFDAIKPKDGFPRTLITEVGVKKSPIFALRQHNDVLEINLKTSSLTVEPQPEMQFSKRKQKSRITVTNAMKTEIGTMPELRYANVFNDGFVELANGSGFGGHLASLIASREPAPGLAELGASELIVNLQEKSVRQDSILIVMQDTTFITRHDTVRVLRLSPDTTLLEKIIIPMKPHKTVIIRPDSVKVLFKEAQQITPELDSVRVIIVPAGTTIKRSKNINQIEIPINSRVTQGPNSLEMVFIQEDTDTLVVPLSINVTEGPDSTKIIVTNMPVKSEVSSLWTFIAIAAGTMLGFNLAAIRTSRRRRQWEEVARLEQPPDRSELFIEHYCRKIALDTSNFSYFSMGVFDPASGGINKTKQMQVKREELQEQIAQVTQNLLQKVKDWQGEEDALLDLSVAVHLEEDWVNYQFMLYQCRREGKINLWQEKDNWKALKQVQKDEPLSVDVLRNLDPSKPGIREQLETELTRLLRQFTENEK